MAKIDEKYTEALGNYNKSLEKIVEILQEQVKRKDTDIMETMLKNMDEKKLSQIVEDLKEIKTTSKKIETNQQKILEEIKSVKKQKEAGMFGEVSDPKNKGKIIDGIKIITLIAGGVLAIGLAFKLIGPIDVISVIGLGIAISLMAVTFSYITEKLKGITIGRTIAISGMMFVMSMAIAASSKVLAFTAPMTLKTMVSVAFTATALGAALYLLTQAVSRIHFNLRTIFGLILLPFLAPIVSTAIVTSSHILKQAATLDFRTILSVTFTSIALGIALYAVTTAVSKMNMSSSVITFLTKGAVFGMIIGAVAGGIVLASWLFSKITPISVMQGLTAIFTAVTLGIVLYAVSKVAEFSDGITIMKAISIGALMVVAAWAIKKSSEILSGVVPFSFTFALGLVITTIAIGIALVAFSFAWKMFSSNMVRIGLGGVGGSSAFRTASTILIVAFTIAAASWILSVGKYDGAYPDWKWSTQVGLSIVVFGGFMMALGKLQIMNKFSSFDKKDIQNVLITSTAIVLTSWILQLGMYTKYPSIKWITDVGLSLILFGGGMFALGKFDPSGEMIAQGLASILIISLAINISSKILGNGVYDKYPNIDWVTEVGLSLTLFGAGMFLFGKFDPSGANVTMGAIAILIVAGTIWLVSKILNEGSYDKFPSLGWSSGVGLSLFTFGLSMTLLGAAIFMTGGLGYVALLAGAAANMLIAQNIVDVAKILAGGTYSRGPSLDWAMGTGILMTAFSASVIALGALTIGTLGVGFIAIYAGVKVMKYIAQSIVDVSKILAGGTYTGGPTFEWANGVGTAIMAFAEGIASMGLATGGILSIFTGIDVEQMKSSIRAVVDGMVEANKKLGGVSWSGNYPTEEWSKGVGTAISLFAEASRSLFGGIFSTDITDKFDGMVNILMDGIIGAARKMQRATDIRWDTLPFPSSDWVTNVGGSIQSFIDLIRKVRGQFIGNANITDVFGSTINTLITGLISVGRRFSTPPGSLIKWDSLPYPKEEWIKNISDSVQSFIILSRKDFSADNAKNLDNMVDVMISVAKKFNNKDVFNDGTSDNINKFAISLKELTNSVPTKEIADRLSSLSESMNKISGFGLSNAASIYLLSKSLKGLGETIQEIDMSVFDKLTKFSSSFTAISLIDNMKLQETIDVLKSRRMDIKAVLDDNSGSARFTGVVPFIPGQTNQVQSPFFDPGVLSNPLGDLVEYNKSIDKNIKELLEIQKAEADKTGTSYSTSTPTSISHKK